MKKYVIDLVKINPKKLFPNIGNSEVIWVVLPNWSFFLLGHLKSPLVQLFNNGVKLCDTLFDACVRSIFYILPKEIPQKVI